MERRSRFAIIYRLLPLLLLLQLFAAPVGNAAPALQAEEPAPPPPDADSLDDFLPPGWPHHSPFPTRTAPSTAPFAGWAQEMWPLAGR